MVKTISFFIRTKRTELVEHERCEQVRSEAHEREIMNNKRYVNKRFNIERFSKRVLFVVHIDVL